MAKMKFGRWLASIEDDGSELAVLADDFRRDMKLNGLNPADFPCPCSVHARIYASRFGIGGGVDVSRGIEALWEYAEPEFRTYRGE